MDSPRRARRALPFLVLLPLLAFVAAAWAAPARTIDVGAAKPTATWDGSGVSGVLGAGPSDDTLVKLSDAGNLTVSVGEFGPTGEEDLDVDVFKADAAGEPVGNAIAEGQEVGEESVAIKNLKPGNYLVQVYAYVGADTTYKGGLKFVSAAPVEVAPAPGSPAPAPGANPATTDQTPSAAITKLAKSSKAKKFRSFAGTASDDKGVGRVEVAIELKKGKKCQQLNKKGKLVKSKKCGAPTSFLLAKGTTSWTFKLKKALKKGKYTAYARAVDSAKQVQGGFGPANKKAFTLK
jgi:hypothetical protein